MAFQSVPETVEIDFNGVIGTVNVQNTFYARRTGGYLLSDMQDLATALWAVIDEDWKVIAPTAVTFTAVTVRGLQFENDVEWIDASGIGTGAVASTELPVNCALAVKRTSGFTGRSARGRIYWYCLHTGQLATDSNFIQGAARDAIVAAVDAVRLAIAAESWTPVIVSRYTNGAPRTVGETFTWVQTSVEDLRIDSRRDRLPGL